MNTNLKIVDGKLKDRDIQPVDEFADMTLTEMAEWFKDHPEEWDDNYEAHRPLTNGKIKNTHTGEAYDEFSRHRDEFDRNLGRNK